MLDIERVEQQLGRKPEGFQQVVKRNRDGWPAIIRVASLVGSTPFPTLFWISDPCLNRLIHQLESGGLTATIQQQLDESESLGQRLEEDHRAHIRLRDSFLTSDIREKLSQMDRWHVLNERGIGGVANFRRVRCLHAFMAAHAVVPNVVGELLTRLLSPDAELMVFLAGLSDGSLSDGSLSDGSKKESLPALTKSPSTE